MSLMLFSIDLRGRLGTCESMLSAPDSSRTISSICPNVGTFECYGFFKFLFNSGEVAFVCLIYIGACNSLSFKGSEPIPSIPSVPSSTLGVMPILCLKLLTGMVWLRAMGVDAFEMISESGPTMLASLCSYCGGFPVPFACLGSISVCN